MHELAIESAIRIIQHSRSEKSSSLRAVIFNGMYDRAATDVQALLDLIVSAQLSSIVVAYMPRGNSAPNPDPEGDLVRWILSTDHTLKAFWRLPYKVQLILYYMKEGSLKLPLQGYTKLHTKYIDIYVWLAERSAALQIKKDDHCHLCGALNDESDLCDNCKNLLISKTEFRNEPFTWHITPATFTSGGIPQADWGSFDLVHGIFRIRRIDLHTISYEILDQATRPTQLLLPFVEYQAAI